MRPPLRRATLVSATVLLLTRAPLAEGAGEEAPSAYTIPSIEAHLVYPTSEIDATDLLHEPSPANPESVVWNLSIDGGENLSTIVLVKVRIAGPSFLAGTKGELVFLAAAGKATLADKKIPLTDLFSERSHEVVVPFLLYGLACGDIHLTATLRGVQGSSPAPTKRAIRVRCGE